MNATATATTIYYFYECGICDCLHPCGFAGDCRDDSNRFALDELEERYGYENVYTVSMDEADDWPASREDD
jgi:hypothetical protein